MICAGPWRPWPPPRGAARGVGAGSSGDRRYAASRVVPDHGIGQHRHSAGTSAAALPVRDSGGGRMFSEATVLLQLARTDLTRLECSRWALRPAGEAISAGAECSTIAAWTLTGALTRFE